MSVLTSYFTTSFVIGTDQKEESQLDEINTGIRTINERLNRIEAALNEIDSRGQDSIKIKNGNS